MILVVYLLKGFYIKMKNYWNFMLGSSINYVIELFGKGSEKYTKFMESKFIFFPCIEVHKVVVLNSVITCEV